jgi:hypothetical protein
LSTASSSAALSLAWRPTRRRFGCGRCLES